MAQKLNQQYAYSYDTLKVLLGGWNTWKEFNTQDPNGYPIEITGGTTPGAGNPIQVITATIGTAP